jgi:hypothetical protein
VNEEREKRKKKKREIRKGLEESETKSASGEKLREKRKTN